MFKRHLLRVAKERVERQCDLQIAAISANSNWDSKENADARRSRIEEIENGTKEMVRLLYSDPEEERAREAEDPYSVENDPLFANVRRMRDEAKAPLPEEAGVGHDLMRHLAAT